MPQPQFDGKITSKDGKQILFILGPIKIQDGEGYQIRMVEVAEMGKWPRIWKGEEVEDDSTN